MSRTPPMTSLSNPNVEYLRGGRAMAISQPCRPVACLKSGASLKSQDSSTVFCFRNHSNQRYRPQNQILKTALSP